jgi:hypothetical protein
VTARTSLTRRNRPDPDGDIFIEPDEADPEFESVARVDHGTPKKGRPADQFRGELDVLTESRCHTRLDLAPVRADVDDMRVRCIGAFEPEMPP